MEFSNSARPLKPRAREVWRESRPKAWLLGFSDGQVRTLAGDESVASRCVTGGKRERPGADALGLFRELLGPRQFRKLKKLPDQGSNLTPTG